MTRRTVLGAVAATAGSAVAGPVAGQSASRTGFSLVQGDACVAVAPLSGDLPVEEFYDLRVPWEYGGDNGAVGTDGPYYESMGTRDLQRPGTTITFLYAGPNGLSLVVVHDDGVDGGGGSVTWRIAGVPTAAGWRVRDDYYTDPETGDRDDTNYDRWDTGGTTHAVDWTWGSGKTDGGALGPLGDGFELEITPAYNEDAALFGEYYDGRITDWQFLSGDPAAPERRSLSLEEPVTVAGGGCGPVRVTIDPRPDSEEDSVNPQSRGVIPVAVYPGDGFDPAAVRVDSLRFGPPRVVESGGGATPAHSGHGTAPLVVHFPVDATGFEDGDTRCKLVGRTRDGTRFFGVEDVRTVGSGGRGDGPPGGRASEGEAGNGRDGGPPGGRGG